MDNIEINSLNQSQDDEPNLLQTGNESLSNAKQTILQSLQIYPHGNPGICLIINIYSFQKTQVFLKELGTVVILPERVGSKQDVTRIKTLFENELKYKCIVKEDLEKSQLIEILKFYSSCEFDSQKDALFIFIMSHGIKGGVIANDGLIITYDEIVECICGDHAPNLFGIPKILLIQACQGNDTVEPVDPTVRPLPFDSTKLEIFDPNNVRKDIEEVVSEILRKEDYSLSFRIRSKERKKVENPLLRVPSELSNS